MELLSLVFFAALGLVIGSFLNVCIDRLPAGQSIIKPPSRCPSCQHRLAARDLIPLLSYLRLKGHCRYCHCSIPKRIVLVELATGILFALLYQRYGLTPRLGIMLFYSCLFIQIFVVDLEQGLILNKVVYPAVGVALLFALFIPQPWIIQLKVQGIANFAIGGGIGFGMLFLIAFLSRGGMGWGDVKLAALIGLATGFPLVFLALVMASIMGGVIAVPLLIMKKKGRKETIPFGPFLVTATFVTLLWGNAILAWYLGFM
jgi:leader peptidase (prepilin peptidase) / N-methyltransferase